MSKLARGGNRFLFELQLCEVFYQLTAGLYRHLGGVALHSRALRIIRDTSENSHDHFASVSCRISPRFRERLKRSGEAGKYLAWTMAKAGHRTAVVERRWIGGSCPNIACMPSKNVIWSAKVASLSGRGPEFDLPSASTVDMAAVRRRKRKLVEDMVNVHLDPAR